ncbi:MAG: tetratricopeptide repeat protein [Candidatus Latescibacterota bacterium]|nr:MAG: tetratricopeptide repeat protein [Candidatus Latescibacterota bacterium]
MVKTNNIRKRALEHAKKQRWDKALEEFERLVEVEQNNPNLFNEIGDLYLKLGKKREAFESYHAAVDAYARISLHNNAVAVCKKILRLNPNDQIVCGKLATLRHLQGFQKDAESYALNFLSQLNSAGDPPTDKVKELVAEVARVAGDAVEVLESAADCLITSRCPDEAGKVLEKLEKIYESGGLTEQCKLVRERMDAIGWLSSSIPGKPGEPEKLETVEAHRSSFAPGASGDEIGESEFDPAPVSPDTGPTGAVEDYGTVDLAQGASPSASGSEAPYESVPPSDAADLPPESVGGSGVAEPSQEGVTVAQEFEEPTAPATERAASTGTVIESDPRSEHIEAGKTGDGEWIIPDSEDEPQETEEIPESGGGVMSELSSEVTADIDEEDYRSHYDLGMAYVEMNLLNEAIREFQFAANSSMYQMRSLEMIGRCFIDQNKPQLAIKQLSRGLALTGDNDEDSLGIRYSLGIAYEMIGDIEKARAYFEDVYVVDVSFRDVAEKMEKYAN